MSEINDYYKYSTLAAAAYIVLNPNNLSPSAIAATATSQSVLPMGLAQQLFEPDSVESGGQPVWNIPAGAYYGNDPTGFAATLFQRGNEKVLAIRGTEPDLATGQLKLDLLTADLAGIGILGLALSQAVSMVNFVMRLRTPATERALQLDLAVSNTQPNASYVEAPSIDPNNPVYFSFSTRMADGLGLLEPNESIVVTGHSLGGHLSALAARLFPDLFREAYVYNSPGFDPDTAGSVAGAVSLFVNFLSGSIGAAAAYLDSTAHKLTDEFIGLLAGELGISPAASFSGGTGSGLASCMRGRNRLGRTGRLRKKQATRRWAMARPLSIEVAGALFHIAACTMQGLTPHVTRRQSYETALAEERAALRRATEDLAAAEQVRQKLAALLPTYQQEERALAKLGEKHLAAELDVVERKRKRIETEQDLKTQVRQVESLRAAISQSERRLDQITSRYREQLQNERVEAQAELDKLTQESAKQQHRNTLLELKAPQEAVVKDLATHTLGTVVSPGTILLTLVPRNEPLQAEVMIRNEDIGFVKEGQAAKVKLAAYPFQKYGLVEGKVVHVSADAEEPAATPSPSDASDSSRKAATSLRYKAVVELAAQSVERDGSRFDISPGMQVVAEIDQGKRTVMEYLLSPVQKTVFDAGRER